VYYSKDADPLKAVTAVKDNPGAVKGPDGQGDFHFGLLKVGPEALITGYTFRTHLLTRVPVE